MVISLQTNGEESNPILKTNKFVMDNAKNVRIDKNKLIEFAKSFNRRRVHWLDEFLFDIKELDSKSKLNFLLVLDSISFSYWGEPKWTVKINGKELDGAKGMIASLKRGVDERRLCLNADFLSKITKTELGYILRGNVEIPLLEERCKILREIGTILKREYCGEFSNLVSKAKEDAIKLLNLIIETFPSFEDISFYKGQKISFYKRAQLLVADIYQAFNGKEYGDLKNISQLTACADYKIPQILRKNGVLIYSSELSEKVDNKIQIFSGSEEEIEIRACTIWAVKYLERLLSIDAPQIKSVYINDRLWLMSQEKFQNDKPYHRTRTISY